jgi:hypothetical protein
MPPHCWAAAQQQDQRENTTCLLSLPSNNHRTDPKEKARFYIKVTLRPTTSRSVSPGFDPHVDLVTGHVVAK